MSNYVIVAETGADIPAELVNKYQIKIVPMHVSFGENTKADMTFPVEDIFEYYEKTGTLPKTSGSIPPDFEKVFDQIHLEYPEKHILYLAYSSVTTCSYQSATIAASGKDYITSIDTKSVSAGQALIVISMARYLIDHPIATLDEVKDKANSLITSIKMGFFPGDLVYLKAGGRVSNAAYLGAKMLNLNPLIEIEDGKLVSKKKYRGSTLKLAPKLVQEQIKKYNLSKDLITLLYSGTIDEKLKSDVEKEVINCGIKEFFWVRAGCVVSTHSGPGAFGIVGYAV